MLRQGPVDKNDGKPREIWELTRRSATLTESHVHHQKFEAKITSQSQSDFPPKQEIACCLSWNFFSSFTSVRIHSPVPLFILFPSHFNDCFLWKIHWPCPTALKSHKSRTPLEHHFFPWSTDPPCQAPGLGSFLAKCVVPQVDVRNRLVDFQCFGKGLWTKNAGKTCEETWELTRCSATPEIWSQNHESKSKQISAKTITSSVFLTRLQHKQASVAPSFLPN